MYYLQPPQVLILKEINKDQLSYIIYVSVLVRKWPSHITSFFQLYMLLFSSANGLLTSLNFYVCIVSDLFPP